MSVAEGEAAASLPAAATRATSYLQILRSTMLIGGSSMLMIVFAIIRNKATALLLGPEGFGLMGLYNAILDLAQTVASLGIQSSGVRQIAEAVGEGDSARIALTTIVLRRVSVALGCIGLLLVLSLALPIARVTFGDDAHVWGVAALSLAVLLRLVSGGQTALLQGMRRIGDLALINVVAAMLGTAATVVLVYWLGEQGIVPSIIAVAAASLGVAWYFTRGIKATAEHVRASQVRAETAALLKLGLAFMASALLLAVSAYLIRLIVMHTAGVAAAGLYQAAWTLGGLYAGFILQAMGADFYPRLTAVCNDDAECNRLVNEQAEIGLLLAGPGLLATLTVAPLVVTLLYSAEFQGAVDVLRWICLGMMLRIVSWPIGFILVAKGIKSLFVAVDALAAAVHVGLAWLLTSHFGVVGAGAAFFGLYVCHGLLVYTIVRRLSGFRWSSDNIRLMAILIPASAVAFAAATMLPFWTAAAVGTAITAVVGLFCLARLLRLVPAEQLPAPVRALVPRILRS